MRRNMARDTSLGERLPGTSTPPMTRSASATSGGEVREAHPGVELAQWSHPAFATRVDADRCTHAVRDGQRVRADIARAEDHDLAGRNAFDAGQQHAAAAVVLLQAPGADLHREAPGDLRHGPQDRQAAVGLADGLEGDVGRARRERGLEQRGIRGEMLETEYGLAAARPALLGRLQLLHLDHQRRRPWIFQPRAGAHVVFVGEPGAATRARVYGHRVAGPHQRADALRASTRRGTRRP